MNQFLTRFRVLPLLVLVAMFAFVVRLGDAYTGVRSLASSAIAADTKGTEKPPAEDAKPEDVKPAEAKPVEATAKETEKDKPAVKLPEVWADPAQQNMADSPAQLQLLEDLAKRREMLNAREKALDAREAMMKAAEKQIDEKVSELSQLKKQIEQLLGQQDAEENNRIMSLVKIYEGMKPKDAATIFNQMGMPVLLKVVSRMSERKVAPILAAMDTGKANELTLQLTEMKKLPEQQTDGGQGEAAGDASAAPVPTPAPAGSAPLPGLDALGK
jgi:flagellar motility protein MotE (MotC chaperone)